MTTPSIPRARIRQWWAEQLATGRVLDLDEMSIEATQVLTRRKE